jgi:monomeric sarcosine oxidase
MYDVIVIGGGIVGASTAYALARQQQDVLLVDQFEPTHKRGSSHGDGRIVRFNYTESIYVEMAKLAYPAWAALSARVGEPLTQQTGLVEYGPVGCEPIAASARVMSQHDIPFERLTAEAAMQRFPQFKFVPDSDILFQADGAVAFADKTVRALWRLVSEEGSTTQTNTRIDDIAVHDDHVTLTDADGQSYDARKIVVTVGGWAKQICAQLGLDLPLKVTQEVLTYFAPTDDSVSHRVGTMPTMVDYHTDAPFYCVPQVDVPGVKAGWHHTGMPVDPDQPQDVSQHLIDGSRGWMARTFPHLENDPFEVVRCLYTDTPDLHFVMDTHPDHDHVIIGAGFSGHGFKFGPTLGDLLARLTLKQEMPLDMSHFSIARFDAPEQLKKRVGA